MARARFKMGLAGAGVFGALHANKLAGDARVDLIAIYDRDSARAQALAGRFSIAAFTDFEPFLEGLEGVSIASAASAHAQQALHALAAGKAVYVEKPLATKLADAQALLDAARASGAVLACGHQERFVLQGLGLFDAACPKPLRVTARRFGPPSGRGLDVSVFLDLMVHDADLALALIGAPAQSVEGVIVAQHNGLADAGEAHIRFQGGAMASLSASRIAPVKERGLELDYASGPVRIDFVTGQILDQAGLGLPIALPQADPLGQSLAAFVSAALGEASPALVLGQAGLEALDLVLRAEAGA